MSEKSPHLHESRSSEDDLKGANTHDFFRGVAFTVIAAGGAGAVPTTISGEAQHGATIALLTLMALGVYEVVLSGEVQYLIRKLTRTIGGAW